MVLALSSTLKTTMSDQLLTTKLHIPQTHANLVWRPRLNRQIDDGMTRPLTLISAPAGFGKTTLISEWRTSATGQPVPLAWLSLESDDNDPVRFWTYVIAALQTLPIQLDPTLRELLRSPQPPPLTEILTLLINNLATQEIPCALVLDDYHLIESSAIHTSLNFLLAHLPRPLHLVILTRVDPPLTLAKLRARGEILELRANDLRFTTEEATDLLNRVMGLSLAPADMALLESRAEGWIAGLQMAVLSMRNRADVSAFVREFSGSHRYIMDYLIEQVLDRESAPVQQFLLQTSILDRLSSELCDTVCLPSSTSSQLLAYLERANVFLVPLDDERRWYRYHHLFVDLLRARLRQTSVDAIPELHRRAAAWYERNGFVSDAVHHALAAEDWESVLRLMERHIAAFIDRGELTTVNTWLNALPREIAHRKPGLGIQLAWARILATQLKEALPLLDDAEQILNGQTDLGLSESEVNRLKANILIPRAYLALMSGNPPLASELASQARQLAGDHPWERSWAYWISGYSARFLGNLERAADYLREAVRVAHASGNQWNRMVFMTDLAMIHGLLGQLTHAIEIYEQTLRTGAERGVRDHGYLGRVEGALAMLLLQQNRIELARQHVENAIVWCERWPSANHWSVAFAYLGRILIVLGDLNGAAVAVQRADEKRRQTPVLPINHSIIDSAQVRLWLAQGNLAAAERWAEELDRNSSPAQASVDEVNEMRWIAYARVLIASARSSENKNGRLDNALELLTRLEKSAEASQRVNSLIEIRVLKALVLHHQLSPAALNVLESSLRLGEPEGYARVFLDEGEPMRFMISDLRLKIVKTNLANYAGKLLTAFPTAPIADRKSEILPDPLSDRELEVLRLIAVGMSNAEIAQKLVVATGTVKAHVASIYRKLDVHSRTQALASAKELGLL